MIIDTLSNANKYFSVHPLFRKAFEFVQDSRPEAMKPGKYVISGDDLNASVTEKAGKTVEESLEKFECHDKHIDIQICISGSEKIGWRPRESCSNKKEEYNSEKDVTFFKDTPDMFFQLTSNQFVIFFPEDVHAPMIGEGTIKKMVIKVRV